VNADRKPDLVAASVRSNTVSVLLNKGRGSFRPKRDSATGAFPHAAAIGDLNKDGKQARSVT